MSRRIFGLLVICLAFACLPPLAPKLISEELWGQDAERFVERAT